MLKKAIMWTNIKKYICSILRIQTNNRATQIKKEIMYKKLEGFNYWSSPMTNNKMTIINSLMKESQKYGYDYLEAPTLQQTSDIDEAKQFYNFKDNGGRDVMLRFDHTEPLRIYIKNHSDKTLPYKRVTSGNVFRAERPQGGRYREFAQLDADIIDTCAVSSEYDSEIMRLLNNTLNNYKKCKGFKILINNRKIIDGFLEHLKLEDNGKEIMIAIDKSKKVSKQQTIDTLEAIIGDDNANKVVDFINTEVDFKSGIPVDIEYMSNKKLKEGLMELQSLIKLSTKLNKTPLVVDLSMVRGLEYYTGNMFEVILNDKSNKLSIAGGGRYKVIDGYYGVGFSIGLDRLMYVINKHASTEQSNNMQGVMIHLTSNEHYPKSLQMQQVILEEGAGKCEILMNRNRKQAYNFAMSNNFLHIITLGKDEILKKKICIQNLVNNHKEFLNFN